mmetsp:Transcript_11679/g.22685  ORF Transcript_11679/g.22685 Transcript_11679/m.22685 type:complete len:223 (-) Transcript_11679:288-956(-)
MYEARFLEVAVDEEVDFFGGDGEGGGGGRTGHQRRGGGGCAGRGRRCRGGGSGGDGEVLCRRLPVLCTAAVVDAVAVVVISANVAHERVVTIGIGSHRLLLLLLLIFSTATCAATDASGSLLALSVFRHRRLGPAFFTGNLLSCPRGRIGDADIAAAHVVFCRHHAAAVFFLENGGSIRSRCRFVSLSGRSSPLVLLWMLGPLLVIIIVSSLLLLMIMMLLL